MVRRKSKRTRGEAQMPVPDTITSDCDNHDSVSIITMNEQEHETVATATPTVVNPNKRRRIMSEPSLTEEQSNTGPKQSPVGWGRKSGSLSPRTKTTTLDFFSLHGPTSSDSKSVEASKEFEKDVLIELCKIVDINHYEINDGIGALNKFSTWACGGDQDRTVFLENFLELGGIQRVVNFLNENQEDPRCVTEASKTIMACTNLTTSETSSVEVCAITNDIVSVLVKRNAIQILAGAGDQYQGENMKTQLEAIQWVWGALMNVTAMRSAYDSADPDAQKVELLSVFQSGMDAMTKLGRNACPPILPREDAQPDMTQSRQIVPYNGVGGADVQLKAVQWLFSSICGGGGSRKRTARDLNENKPPAIEPAKEQPKPRKTKVVDNSMTASKIMVTIFSTLRNMAFNSKLVREDFLEMNLFKNCMRALKTPDTGEWIPNKELLIEASKFFVQCQEEKILSTSEDFQVVFPVVVECIGKYPEEAHYGKLFKFIKDTCSEVDTSFVQSSGVIRAIATALESDMVDKDTKDASHQLLKDLL